MLRAFLLALFEPLVTVSLLAVTFLMFVSITLDLGARRGELGALRLDQLVRLAAD